MIENINDIAGLCHTVAHNKGFWDQLTSEPKIPMDLIITQKLALIGTEVSEAVEAVRSGDHENLGEELADVIIRTLDLAYCLGFDAAALIRTKMQANKDRPHMHGRRF